MSANDQRDERRDAPPPTGPSPLLLPPRPRLGQMIAVNVAIVVFLLCVGGYALSILLRR